MTNWFKVVRADRDLILKKCGNSAPSVMMVWLAFCDFANRNQASVITVGIVQVSRAAGISHRTTERIIPRLQKLGLLTVKKNVQGGCWTPSTYTLPTFIPPVPTPGPSRHNDGTPPGPMAEPSRRIGGTYSKTLNTKTPDKKGRSTVKRGF